MQASSQSPPLHTTHSVQGYLSSFTFCSQRSPGICSLYNGLKTLNLWVGAEKFVAVRSIRSRHCECGLNETDPNMSFNQKSRGGKNNRSNQNASRPQTHGDGNMNDDGRTDLLEKSDMQNAKFEAYYKAQKIVQGADVDGAGKEEWAKFIESLREPLPTTFRIAGTRQCVISYYLLS